MGIYSMPLPGSIAAIALYLNFNSFALGSSLNIESDKSGDDQIIRIYADTTTKNSPTILRSPGISLEKVYNERHTVCAINLEMATKDNEVILIENIGLNRIPVILFEASSSLADGMAYYVHHHSIGDYNLYVEKIDQDLVYVKGWTADGKSKVSAIFTIDAGGALDYRDGSCVQTNLGP